MLELESLNLEFRVVLDFIVYLSTNKVSVNDNCRSDIADSDSDLTMKDSTISGASQRNGRSPLGHTRITAIFRKHLQA
jgi:hypothetical protein